MASNVANLSNLHSDIIKTHILPKLDGPSLLAVGSSSSDLRSLCSGNEIWKDICQSTWPNSVNDPRVSEAISTFPSGHRSFYQESFPVLDHFKRRPELATGNYSQSSSNISELISAIDIRYQDQLVYSKVQVTETQNEAFLSNPLRVELVEPNPSILPGFSRVNFDESEKEFLAQVEENVTLNWVMIDPTHKRAGNFSSVRPIFARANWMTNEVHMRFVTILPATADPSEFVQCRIEVTCEGKEGGELHVREVNMHLHDMDSKCLTGEESLLIFRMAMEGGRRKLGKRGEEKVKYEEFLKMRKERKERRVRRESRKANINRILQLSTFVVSLVCVSEFLIC